MRSKVFGIIGIILGICATLFPTAFVLFAYLRAGWEGVLWASLSVASWLDNILAITFIAAIVVLCATGGAPRKPHSHELSQEE